MKLCSETEISEAQFKRIERRLPRQQGNVSLSALQVLIAPRYVAEQGCKWRGLPPRFGRWHTIDYAESLVSQRCAGAGATRITHDP
ncbi:transposase [Burkholderia ambifaria]|nr:transposase [Burkholderia ambifaria]ELK6211189.1 transposase [Burkholderia ambifaria]